MARLKCDRPTPDGFRCGLPVKIEGGRYWHDWESQQLGDAGMDAVLQRVGLHHPTVNGKRSPAPSHEPRGSAP